MSPAAGRVGVREGAVSRCWGMGSPPSPFEAPWEGFSMRHQCGIRCSTAPPPPPPTHYGRLIFGSLVKISFPREEIRYARPDATVALQLQHLRLQRHRIDLGMLRRGSPHCTTTHHSAPRTQVRVLPHKGTQFLA